MSQLLPLIAAINLGLLAGALLAEDRLLVPYWRTLSADIFYKLHPTFGPLLYRFFAPLTMAAPFAALLATAQIVVQSGCYAPSSLASIAATVLTFSLVGFYTFFFKSANAAFERHAISDADLPAALARWAAWHRARVVVCVTAFVLSLAALVT